MTMLDEPIAGKNPRPVSFLASQSVELLIYPNRSMKPPAGDPIDSLIGAATRKVNTDAVMRTTRGKNWNKP